MSEGIKEHHQRFLKYFNAFQGAWQNFLKALEKGEFHVPYYEEELRCLLFSKCLETMSSENFQKPYQIFAEDRGIAERARPDITFGLFENDEFKARFVTVEAKHLPSLDKIREDIKKVREYVVRGESFSGFFVMIGRSTKEYRKDLNLKELGIQQEIREGKATVNYEGKGEKSFYQWKLVKIQDAEPLETLLVGIIA
jgi:hypothetical protein